MKQISSFMITPEEALALSDHVNNSMLCQAARIAHACLKDPDYHELLTFATIYRAGMIDGIRRERARRGKRQPIGSSHRDTAIALLDKIQSERTLRRIANYIECLWEQEP